VEPPSLAGKHYTKVELNESEKHTSLLRSKANYDRQSFNRAVAGTDLKSSSLSAHLRRHRRRHGRHRLEGPRRRRGHQAFPPPFCPEGARLRPAQHQALD
jgi:hypothetical protein